MEAKRKAMMMSRWLLLAVVFVLVALASYGMLKGFDLSVLLYFPALVAGVGYEFLR